MKKLKPYLFLLLFLNSFLFSCRSVPSGAGDGNQRGQTPYEKEAFIPETFQWETVTEGFDVCSVYLPETPLIYHIVRIDFSAANTQICGYNASENNNRGLSPSSFAQRTAQNSRASVSINTSPFEASGLYYLFPKSSLVKYYSMGIHKEKDHVYSEALPKYAALCLKTEGNRVISASVIRGQTPQLIPESDYCFGGYYVILENETPVDFPARNLDSRTACGITEDGTTLFILSVEGEVKTKSTGLSYQDCALIFQKLGCCSAMEFDGGGSSSLFINGKNRLTHKKTRNVPAYLGLCIQ